MRLTDIDIAVGRHNYIVWLREVRRWVAHFSGCAQSHQQFAVRAEFENSAAELGSSRVLLQFCLVGEARIGNPDIAVFIDVNAVLEGNIVLGDRVTIGPNVVMRNATVGDDVTILANCVIEDAEIGNGSRIGPFARLRPETRLATHTHVGNFVEIKKSDVGTGSKINHLSYIGDTSVGSGVNIGAGTITCNYDGANKFRTVIGDNVFIGSDTQLIAPVEIMDGATIGAGSTITRDAPANELTLSRAPQQTRTGWQRPVKNRKGDRLGSGKPSRWLLM